MNNVDRRFRPSAARGARRKSSRRYEGATLDECVEERCTVRAHVPFVVDSTVVDVVDDGLPADGP